MMNEPFHKVQVFSRHAAADANVVHMVLGGHLAAVTQLEVPPMGRIRLLAVLIVVATFMVLLSPALFRAQMDAARTKERWDKKEVRQR